MSREPPLRGRGDTIGPAGAAEPAAPHPAGLVSFVGTPIGNLGDMAPRAAEALQRADVVACEDTRRTGRLLQLLGVDAPGLVRMDDHTEAAVSARLIERARQGRHVAVVSDAGMPGLSDPGGRLLRDAVAAGVAVEVVPGPFAGALAAVASGLLDPAGRFVFEGFLPRKGPTRRERLDEVAAQRRTVVLYEAPHRVAATLGDLVTACGPQRRVALCRELTKLHEEVWRGTLGEALERVADRPPRGELVVVIEGATPAEEPSDDALRAAVARELAGGASRRDAAVAVAAAFGVAPNRVKRLAVS